MIHFVNFMPMITRSLNILEFINETFVLFSGPYLVLFTDFVPQIETRYDLGTIYMYILVTVIGVDCLIVLYGLAMKIVKKI